MKEPTAGIDPEPCKVEAFLSDPITQTYGMGSEMSDLIACDCRECSGGDDDDD